MDKESVMSGATQAQIKRVVEAARKAGMPIGAIEVTRDGTVRIIAQPDKAPQAIKEIRI
jgi:polysaccharide deacetylase 2 family uncharacterized protein YibQ